ncbi:MAG: molybdopterin molybdenumtransferase MoeA, partial [Armatimonadetes bacterium]|nr:molybdopterin molybdenumtransferase MoeA [Armatimonadota bacterium]
MRTWAELVSADEARRRFAAAWTPRIRTEEIPTEEALGRVLATPILSPEDLPPFSRALMDGFACRAADLQGAPVELAVLGEVLMGGRAPVPVRPGGAIQIPTGGMLPEGADVVVPIEQTEAAGDRVRVLTELAAGRHCIARGEDVAQGQELLPQERRLRSADVGALIGLGILQVLVYARPVVGILATGDEI